MSTESASYRVPCGNTLQHAVKLAIVDDKPIMMDYWASSCDKDVLIGIRESGEKLLVKSEDEYTSPVSKIYKVGEGEDAEGKALEDYIIITENSIYLINADIETKRIS